MARSKLRYQSAIRAGENKICELGLAELPINPIEIASQHTILVEPKPSTEPGVSGFLMKRGDAFGIMYATDIDNEGRKRFTVAHELGHYFLPGHPELLFRNGNGVHASRSGFITHDHTELEADHFATGLLMPSHLFIAAIADKDDEGFKTIERLAARCVTSLTATAIRYAQCSDDPVVVIVTEGDRVEFSFMSGVIRDLQGIDWMTKGSVISRRTATFQFNQDRENIVRCRRSEAWTTLDLWLDGAPDVEMKEDVVGLGGYGKTLTVLFTEEPIETERDDDDDDD
ncbi:MAG: ImmA/IrrE family metallo-endopeptidase [Phycisphaeraceae bacterium]|nr:MAG: ImmA/IrrE family metallo-endopeptidase [Phycisphaeraceae bacterium]